MRRRTFLYGSVAMLTAPLAIEAQPTVKLYRIGFLGRTANTIASLSSHGSSSTSTSISSSPREPRPPWRRRGRPRRYPLSWRSLAIQWKAEWWPALLGQGGMSPAHRFSTPSSTAKRLEVLKDALPGVARVAVLMNPDNPAMDSVLRVMEERAAPLNVKLWRMKVRLLDELEGAFKLAKGRVDALTVIDEGLFIANPRRIADLATSSRLPSVGFREFCESGGLIAYGVNFPFIWRTSNGVRGQDPQRRQAWKSTNPAGDKVRAGDQSPNREDSEPHDPSVTPGARGPGDRVRASAGNADRGANYSLPSKGWGSTSAA
jgi:hypothetical protein